MALLALPEFEQNLRVTEGIGSRHTVGHIFALVLYPEDVAALEAAGVESTWNLYAEAGKGFAEEVVDYLGDTIGNPTTGPPGL